MSPSQQFATAFWGLANLTQLSDSAIPRNAVPSTGDRGAPSINVLLGFCVAEQTPKRYLWRRGRVEHSAFYTPTIQIQKDPDPNGVSPSPSRFENNAS
jgi:hypothetical protein